MNKLFFLVSSHLLLLALFLTIFSVNVSHGLFWLSFSYTVAGTMLYSLGLSWMSGLVVLMYGGAVAMLLVMSLIVTSHQMVSESLSLGAIGNKPMLLGLMYVCLLMLMTKVNAVTDFDESQYGLASTSQLVCTLTEFSSVSSGFFEGNPLLTLLTMLSLLLPVVLVLTLVSSCTKNVVSIIIFFFCVQATVASEKNHYVYFVHGDCVKSSTHQN